MAKMKLKTHSGAHNKCMLTKNGKIDRKCLMEEYRESMQNRVKS